MVPELLRTNRNFRLYFIGRSITALTLAIGPVVLPFAVLAAHGSATSVATVLTAQEAPIIVLVLIGGVLGDRYERMTILAGANTLSSVAQFIMAALLLTHTAEVPTLLAAALLSGLAAAVALPAGAGFVSYLVEPPDVAQAQALLSASRTAVMVGGAALGGVMVSFVGPGVALLLNGVFFISSTVPLLLIKPVETDPPPSVSLVRSLGEGWREFWGKRWIAVTVGQTLSYTTCMVAGFQILAPTIASERFNGAAGLGLLMSARALGGLLGATGAVGLRPRRPLFLGQLCLLAQGAILAMMGLSLPYPLLIGAIILDGAAAEYFMTVWHISVQLRVSRGLLSRMNSYFTLIQYCSTPLAAALMIPLSGHLSASSTFLLLAGVTLGATTLITSLPPVRGLGPVPAAERAGRT